MEKVLDFKVEASNPRNNSIFDNEDTKLSEAIYTIFPLETEDAILSWGEASIPLSYRYDISTIIDDVIQMVFTLQNNSDGQWFVDWPSNTFATNWALEWSGDNLRIMAAWRKEFQAENYLKEHSVLNLKKRLFLGEWKKIIDVLLENLKNCGYTGESLIDMAGLIEASKIVKN